MKVYVKSVTLVEYGDSRKMEHQCATNSPEKLFLGSKFRVFHSLWLSVEQLHKKGPATEERYVHTLSDSIPTLHKRRRRRIKI